MYANRHLIQLLLHMYLMNVMTFMELVRFFSMKHFQLQLKLCQNWNILATILTLMKFHWIISKL